LDKAASNEHAAVCKLPALATSYSVSQFAIEESRPLTGKWFGTAEKEVAKLSDGMVLDDYVDSLSTGCNFGITLKKGQVGVL